MGKNLKTNTLYFISFQKKDDNYEGYISLDAAMDEKIDLKQIVLKATKIYSKSIFKMQSLNSELVKLKKKKPIPAYKIWLLGDEIFRLKHNLEKISVQLDNLYDHLTRDLSVKRKWLEKIIIFRRYIVDIKKIQKTLNWGLFEHSTSRKAKRLNLGQPIE